MRVNVAKRVMTLKVVYYGPGLSGKTTNLTQLHARVNASNRGALVQLDTETERTLFFDYFPVVLGTISGFRVKVDFFTVPGQSFYSATRRAVLESADGVVFVADSSESREEANQLSRQDMIESLASMGRPLDTVPHVYQWNKRDLPDALPVKLMERMYNPDKAPSIEASAAQGIGIMETQSLILNRVLETVRQSAAQKASNG